MGRKAGREAERQAGRQAERQAERKGATDRRGRGRKQGRTLCPRSHAGNGQEEAAAGQVLPASGRAPGARVAALVARAGGHAPKLQGREQGWSGGGVGRKVWRRWGSLWNSRGWLQARPGHPREPTKDAGPAGALPLQARQQWQQPAGIWGRHREERRSTAGVTALLPDRSSESGCAAAAPRRPQTLREPRADLQERRRVRAWRWKAGAWRPAQATRLPACPPHRRGAVPPTLPTVAHPPRAEKTDPTLGGATRTALQAWAEGCLEVGGLELGAPGGLHAVVLALRYGCGGMV